jgi:hypothetical protein
MLPTFLIHQSDAYFVHVTRFRIKIMSLNLEKNHHDIKMIKTKSPDLVNLF